MLRFTVLVLLRLRELRLFIETLVIAPSTISRQAMIVCERDAVADNMADPVFRKIKRVSIHRCTVDRSHLAIFLADVQ